MTKINLQQAIAENWRMTIPAWCEALKVGLSEKQALQRYHRDYTDAVLRSRIGQPVNPSAKITDWILNHDEFLILQKYRETRRMGVGVRGKARK